MRSAIIQKLGTAALAGLLFAGGAAAQQSGSPAKPAQSSPAKSATAQKASARPVAARPTAVLDTSAGKITCALFPEKAPVGVANFAGLAMGTKDWTDPRTGQLVHGKPLYDGTVCHRTIPGFMIQCGDPLGTGMGGPGYHFDNEITPDLKFDAPGLLAYANAGLDENGHGTNGSQFFITEGNLPPGQQMILNGNYTIFGQCTPGSVEVVKQIARGPHKLGSSDQALDPAVIQHITILNWKPAAKKPAARPATTRKPATATSKPPAAPPKP